MDADELQQAMHLADIYAMKRARCAAHPFTTEEQEREADEACDNARAALQLFLASSTAGVAMPRAPADLLALAKSCGAVTYTNRHLPGEPAVAFGNESWARFCAALGVALPDGGQQR